MVYSCAHEQKGFSPPRMMIITHDRKDHIYRLIGVIDPDDNYINVAKLNCGAEGWIEINVRDNHNVEQIEFNDEEYGRRMAFYEKAAIIDTHH